MMLRNFLYRIAEYVRENRRLLIKSLLIAAAALIAFLLIWAGVERWHRAKYEKRIQALEQQYRGADARAQQAEAQAETIKQALEIKYAELHKLEGQAAAAELALKRTQARIAPLKETYEQARDTPINPAADSCADLCRELAGLGHPCR